MRGVDDIREWRNALNELSSGRKGIGEDNEDLVYKRLKFSYSRLKDEDLQQCFLHCAMYPEDHKIRTEKLIEYWIAEGLIAQMNSQEAMFDKGRAILNKLINSCLLEEGFYESEDDQSYVRMHDLIRDMALKIIGPRFLVHAGMGIREVSDEVWCKDPEKVSLMWNEIEVLPSNPPIFHRLTTLLLNANPDLRHIPDSFFSQMPLLTVLDLSWTSIVSLPECISNLENLQSLLAGRNFELKTVPSLVKLKALKRLDFSGTVIREIPQGIEELVNLKDLNLSGNFKLKYVPSLGKLKALERLDLSETGIRGIPEGIEELVNLKDLNLWDCRLETFPFYKLVGLPQLQRLRVRQGVELLAEDLVCFGQLKVLCARFKNMEELTKYIKSEQFSMLENYGLLVEDSRWGPKPLQGGNTIYIGGVELSRSEVDAMVGARNLNFLVMARCHFHDMVSIFDIQSLYDARNLRSLGLGSCYGMESVFSSSSSYFSRNLRSIENKKLCVLPNYRVPSNGVGTQNNIFINLNVLTIVELRSIKNIFSVMLLQSFPNLTVLSVWDCSEIEEIIIEEEGHNQNHNVSNSITLSNLRRLRLNKLSRLESIYKGIIMACQLKTIEVIKCDKLRRLPLSTTAAPRLQTIVGEREWWESLEWDDVHTKTIFEPLFIPRR